MLFVVDVGNTHTVLGVYDGTRLIHDFRIKTSKGRTADETQILLTSLLPIAGIDRQEVRASIVASVVPALTDTLCEAIDRTFDHEPLIVGPGIKTGMPILYENPREVGADRIVNAVAAYERVRDAVIVVDFGTATTFDCISAKGEYLGGSIAPGMAISAHALFTNAARLPRTEIAKPPRAIGRNTIHSMQSGIVYGYVGLIEGMVDRLAAEMGGVTSVIATGGFSQLIADETEMIDEVDDLLTLEGLRIIYERNR